jgi:hypothetical protein
MPKLQGGVRPSVIVAPRGNDMLNYIGTLAMLDGVSDPALNGRLMTVLKAYVEEDKFLLDATLPDALPCNVRYIKVSVEKIRSFSDQACAAHARAPVLAHNRDKAFSDVDLDVRLVWAIDSRQHPSVRPRCAFSDVPLLQERLNNQRAQGHPFQLVVGYFVFADMPAAEIYPGTQYPAVFSSEPIVLLKDRRGQIIDPTVDLEVATNPSMTFRPRKLFIEEPRLNKHMMTAGMDALFGAREFGFLQAVPWAERFADGPEEDPAALGMLPRAIAEGAKLADESGGSMVHIFKDGGLGGYEKDKKRWASYGFLTKLRRKALETGAVICSRELFVEVCTSSSSSGGTILSADMFGNMCFACYMRLTVNESKVCGGCGKARYCSGMCQNSHWKEHRLKCAPIEERKKRREAAALARQMRATELAKHDQLVALERAEEAATDAVRKHQAVVARADKAEKDALESARLQKERPARPSDAGQSHRGRNSTKKTTIEDQLVHASWSSERERQVRSDVFNLRQEARHLEAEARKAQKHVDKIKAKMAEELKKQAAAGHEVPSRASVGQALEEALFTAV